MNIILNMMFLGFYKTLTVLFGTLSLALAMGAGFAIQYDRGWMAAVFILLTVPAVGIADWTHQAFLKLSEADVGAE